jgi:hypothetical protein
MDAAKAAAALMGDAAPARDSSREAMQAVGNATFGKVLSLSDLYVKRNLAADHRPGADTVNALRERIAAGKAKVAAAEEAGHRKDKVSRARQTIAELEDELATLVRAEVYAYATETAYLIGRDFLRFREAMSLDTDNLLTFNLPGVATITVDLNGTDDEPPF